MSVFLQFPSEGDERLNIASTPNDLNDNVELDFASNKLGIGWRWGWGLFLLILRPGDQTEHGFTRIGIEVDIDAAVLYQLLRP